MRFLHTTFIQPVAQMLVLYSIAECKSSALLTCRDAPPVTPDCLIASLLLLLLSTWTLGTVLSKLCLLPVICGKIALIVLLKAKSTYPASQSQFSVRCNSLLTPALPANHKSHALLQTLDGPYTEQHSACGPFMFCISHASPMMLCNRCRVG